MAHNTSPLTYKISDSSSQVKMCKRYILYHLCGHSAVHKILPCSAAVNSKIDFIFQSPPTTHQSVRPSPTAPNLASPTSTESDSASTYRTTSTVPNSISRYYQPKLQTCEDPPEKIYILPELCDQCFKHGMAGEYLNNNSWAKADVLLAWKAAILEGTFRGRQVLDEISIIGDEDTISEGAPKGENNGPKTNARVGDLRTRLAALETRVRRLTLRKPVRTQVYETSKVDEATEMTEPIQPQALETIHEEESETMEFIAPPPVAQSVDGSGVELDDVASSTSESDGDPGSGRSEVTGVDDSESSHTSSAEVESPEKRDATEREGADSDRSEECSTSEG
jgi:hypothetical protein